VGPWLVLRLGARLLVLVPSSRRKHYKLDILFYCITDNTISKNNSTKNITGSPITNPNINDTNDNIIDTQREENSPQHRQLRTRAKEMKQKHKLTMTVYKIFEGGTHQGYICGFNTK
jgi:hypothetical protein